MKLIQRRQSELWVKKLRIGNGANVIVANNGSPESAIVGFIGDIDIRPDGGAGTTINIKESNNGLNIGWVGK